jgi:hypothetical protein
MGFRRKATPEEDAVADDEWLTQYGDRSRPINGRSFKNHPPFPGEVNALSLIRGRLSVSYVPISRGTARKLARMTGDHLVNAMHAAYGQQSITVAFAVNGRIEMGECLEIRAVENSRAEAISAVKRKAARDSSAIEGLAAAV